MNDPQKALNPAPEASRRRQNTLKREINSLVFVRGLGLGIMAMTLFKYDYKEENLPAVVSICAVFGYLSVIAGVQIGETRELLKREPDSDQNASTADSEYVAEVSVSVPTQAHFETIPSVPFPTSEVELELFRPTAQESTAPNMTFDDVPESNVVESSFLPEPPLQSPEINRA